MKNKQTFYVALALVILAGISRLAPHPMNFTPITAIALFSMYAFKGKWKFIIPISAIVFSDILLELTSGTGFHSGTWMVYGGFALILLIGFVFLRKASIPRILGSSVISSTVFFLFTNFAFFYPAKSSASVFGYPHSWEGIIGSYTAGLPFFRNMLSGDLVYSAVLFGAYFLVKRFIIKPALAQ